MSDGYWDQSDEPAEETNLVKDLRKQIKDQATKAQEAEARAAAAEKSLAERTLADTLATLKVPSHLAKWIAKDDVNLTDADAVAKWVKDNGADFGLTGDDKGGQQSDSQPAETAPQGRPDADLSGYEAVQAVGGLSAPANVDKYTQAATQIKPEWTQDQVYEFFRSQGL